MTIRHTYVAERWASAQTRSCDRREPHRRDEHGWRTQRATRKNTGVFGTGHIGIGAQLGVSTVPRQLESA